MEEAYYDHGRGHQGKAIFMPTVEETARITGLNLRQLNQGGNYYRIGEDLSGLDHLGTFDVFGHERDFTDLNDIPDKIDALVTEVKSLTGPELNRFIGRVATVTSIES